MWEYSDRNDPSRVCAKDLDEAEVDAKIISFTALKKGDVVPDNFGKEPFSRTLVHSEVKSLALLYASMFFAIGGLEIFSLYIFVCNSFLMWLAACPPYRKVVSARNAESLRL
jgi:hypothetical protein